MEDVEQTKRQKMPKGSRFCTTNKCTCLVLLVLFVAIAIVVVITLFVPGVRGDLKKDKEKLEWWETSIIYQIYPRSFQDTNGDGIGDLKVFEYSFGETGITSRLNYVEEINVGAIWISPFYKSPMRDFGYDVTNYTEIDPIFGNMTDFEILLKEAHKRGLKVIIDFVPNHTSNDSHWFTMSRTGTDEHYKDYYVWNPGKKANGTRLPPNNWQSVFGGSAWEWDETRQQYYYHAFLVSQPDLNYRNPLVLKEIDDVLTFWLEKGVDGFRIDAIPHLFEVSNVSLDEPEGETNGFDPTLHKYTKNQEETYDVVRRWRNLVQKHEEKSGKKIVLIAEAFGVSHEQRNKYYDAGSIPFFFDLINAKSECGATSACYAKIIIDGTNLTKGQWPNFVMGNHDQRRIADTKGPEYVDAMNMMLLTLPGTPTTYNGEELGMRGGDYTGMTPQDPYAITSNNPENSRDSERNPMQWDDTQNAGFTNGTPWLSITPNTNYKDINVKVEFTSISSHLGIYKRLAELRQSPAFQNADIDIPETTGKVLAYIRKDSSSRYLVALNLNDEQATIKVEILNTAGQVVLSTDPTRNSQIDLSKITLKKGEGIVIKLVKA